MDCPQSIVSSCFCCLSEMRLVVLGRVMESTSFRFLFSVTSENIVIRWEMEERVRAFPCCP